MRLGHPETVHPKSNQKNEENFQDSCCVMDVVSIEPLAPQPAMVVVVNGTMPQKVYQETEVMKLPISGNQTIQIYGKFGGISLINNALFGLVV